VLGLVLNDVPNRISLSGHTDSTPYIQRAGYSNWELSADRANASRRELVRGGMADAKVLRVVGLGSAAPPRPQGSVQPDQPPHQHHRDEQAHRGSRHARRPALDVPKARTMRSRRWRSNRWRFGAAGGGGEIRREAQEDSMTRKKILGSHVKRLLSGVSDHGRRHLSEVETDLVQTNCCSRKRSKS
jgi:hypothetical protein